MKEKILLLIEDVLDLEKGTINENTKKEDIPEWDSLGHVMIISGIKEQLNVSIPIEKASEIKSVKDILDVVGE